MFGLLLDLRMKFSWLFILLFLCLYICMFSCFGVIGLGFLNIKFKNYMILLLLLSLCVCVCVYLCVCMYVSVCVYLCVCMYVSLSLCVCVCVFCFFIPVVVVIFDIGTIFITRPPPSHSMWCFLWCFLSYLGSDYGICPPLIFL